MTEQIETPVLSLAEMAEEVAAVNHANGWFDEDRDFAADIALLHSEVSEMFEAYRNWELADATAGERYDGTVPKPEGVGSECADVLIRLLDTCFRNGIDLEGEYHRKLAFNRTRGYKHGGKRI